MKPIRLRLRPKPTRRSGTDELNILKGAPDDGKKRIMVLGNDYTRFVLLPEKNPRAETAVGKLKYETLKDLTRIPPILKKQEYVKKMMSDNLKRENKLKEQLKFIETGKRDKPKPTEPEKDKIARENFIKKRSEVLKAEEQEAIKKINSEIAKAKCMAIVQKQIEQKAIKEKKAQEEKERQDQEILKFDKTLYLKYKADKDEQKRRTIESCATFFKDQLQMKQIEKSLKQAETEQEKTNQKLVTIEENRRKIEEMEKKEQEKKNLRKQQQDLILTAQILKQKEIEEDKMMVNRIERMRISQEKKENVAKENFRTFLQERNAATDKMIQKKKDEEKLKLEAEEYAIRMKDNEFEKEWRQKEKEKMVNEIEKRKIFREGIEKQIDEKYKQKTIEIFDEIERVQEIKNKLEELNIKADQNEQKRQEEKKKLAEHLKLEAQNKIRSKKKRELEEEKFWAVLREMDRKKKEFWKQRLDEKIKELEAYEMDERLLHSVKRKAEDLKAHELGD